MTSFAETPDGGQNMHVRLRVVANLSALSPDEFWAEMQRHAGKLAYLLEYKRAHGIS
ncbi:hypothetical protein [Saccharopolyspora sp. NPDC002686]|uniref:hypothetical protein n=1 Tax=Saccharopolyspora sp. NPDC002686 TaxID=3154541 RepID=UPI00331A42E2